MRDDFAVFILTHGRAQEQKTYKTLKRSGYSGRIFLIIDDEDSQGDQYKAQYGDQVIEFSKSKMEDRVDIMTNRVDHRAVVYARNESYRIADNLGIRFFCMCDDDISAINMRILEGTTLACYKVTELDEIFEIMCETLELSPGLAMFGFSESGMYIGGANEKYLKGYKDDVAQIFVVDAQKPVSFKGLIYEDLHAILDAGSKGLATLSTTLISAQTPVRSTNKGGMQEAYKACSSYTGAFYNVMAFPGAISVRERKGEFGVYKKPGHYVPMILDERWRK